MQSLAPAQHSKFNRFRSAPVVAFDWLVAVLNRLAVLNKASINLWNVILDLGRRASITVTVTVSVFQDGRRLRTCGGRNLLTNIGLEQLIKLLNVNYQSCVMDSEGSYVKEDEVMPQGSLIDKAPSSLDPAPHERSQKTAVDETGECGKEQEKPFVNSFTACETLRMDDGTTVVAKIQTDKYFPFSKRCVRVGDTSSLLKLSGNLAHGAHMFKLLKHDYNEEFEHLPRAGQKIGSHLLAEQTDIQNKRIRLYNRLRQAYNCPRYLELWRSELGHQVTVPITAELNWQNGRALSSHTSLGSFGKYFGTMFSGTGMDSHSLMRKLNPYEAMFLADCGTMQVTASQCPLGMEDLLAIQESNVWRFANRYLVFSELHRITRFAFKTYAEEAKMDFVEPQVSVPAVQPVDFLNSRQQKRFKQYPQAIQNRPSLPHGSGQVQELRGFFSEDLGNPQDMLALPALQTDDESTGRMKKLLDAVDASGPVKPSGQYGEGSAQSSGNLTGSRDLRNTFHRRVQVRAPNYGIDLAFFGCLKTADFTPPLFDIAITNYRDHTINVSELFLSLEKRKNHVLPMLVERVDYGQVSGYALIPARVPAVDYIGQT